MTAIHQVFVERINEAGSRKAAQQCITRGRLDTAQGQRLRGSDCVNGERGPVLSSPDSSPGPFPAESSRESRT